MGSEWLAETDRRKGPEFQRYRAFAKPQTRPRDAVAMACRRTALARCSIAASPGGQHRLTHRRICRFRGGPGS